jgi:hypothetical protein
VGIEVEGLFAGFILYCQWDVLLAVGNMLYKCQSPIKCGLASIVYHRAEYFVPHTEAPEGLRLNALDVVPEPRDGRATA